LDPLHDSLECGSHNGNEEVQEDDNQEQTAAEEDDLDEIELKDQILILHIPEGVKLEVSKGHSVGVHEGFERVVANEVLRLQVLIVLLLSIKTVLHDVEATSKGEDTDEKDEQEVFHVNHDLNDHSD
jgi:hypothetical protein